MKSQQTLRNLLLVVFLFSTLGLFTSCDRIVTNSAENDELIASVANLQGSTDFKNIVYTIVGKCANCHTHEAWYGYNEDDYSAAGLVTFGNYPTSKLYFRLSNASEGQGPHNMPQGGGAAFTDDEISLLKTWITNN
jgi:uncharacterized membrane protein